MDSGLLAPLGPGMTRHSSAARFDWGAGNPLSMFCSQKMRGSKAPTGAGAERRTRWLASRSSRSPGRRRSPKPMTRARARLSALCCGVFLTTAGRAFVDGASVPIDRQPAPGRGSLCPRAEPRRRPSARVRTSPAGAAPAKARNCRAPAAGFETSSPAPPPARSTLKTPHECAPSGEQGVIPIVLP